MDPIKYNYQSTYNGNAKGINYKLKINRVCNIVKIAQSNLMKNPGEIINQNIVILGT